MRKLLDSLSLRQKISVVAAALLVVAGLWGFTRWRHENDFRPLFTAMMPEDAGAVVQKLKESGIEYKLSGSGSAILVPSARLAELRLSLAAAGLPKSGRIGFELFDKTNFGATEFTEQVNYHRALEGELERSVMSLTEVEQARVHLTFPRDSVFLESRQPAKGSVMVRLRPGARLTAESVLAICHLVSSAIEGLQPEAVSVLDMQGHLLSRPRRPGLDAAEPSEAVLEYRKQIEVSLLSKINSTLEPLLGPDRFRAGASVECDFTSGEQSEEVFDPSHSVMSTSQKTEDVSGPSTASGVPGTASNLPRPTSRPGSGMTGLSRRTENITYQSSRTVRRVRTPQGSIKRISVSVLVDQDVRWQRQGTRLQRLLVPPSAERMKSIRDVVAGVIGFTPERGDQLVVETLPFESTLNQEPPSPPSTPKGAPHGPTSLYDVLANRNLLIAAAAAAVLLLLLAAGMVVQQVRRKRRKAVELTLQPSLPAPATEPPAVEASEETAEKELAAQVADREALQKRLEADVLKALKAPPAATKRTEVLTRHVRENVKKDRDVALHILRSWLKDEPL